MIEMQRREFIRATAVAALAEPLLRSGRTAMSAGHRIETKERDGMILIPAGPAILGTSPSEIAALAERYGIHPSWLGDEMPRRTTPVDAFWIDAFEVTNEEYLRFTIATNRPWRLSPPSGRLSSEAARLPVTGVNWFDAEAYAQWAGKRLPSEHEWEKAARGPDGLVYPWGDDFDPDRCTWNRDDHPMGNPRLTPVDAFPDGRSPYGVWDLSGNVSEWCADTHTHEGHSRAVRGGGWHITLPYRLRPAFRGESQFPNNGHEFRGFRCARSAEAES